MQNTDPSRYLTLGEAASELRISRRTAAALVAAGRLPVHRPSPRRIVVARADLDAYMAARRQAAVR
jgi:excisionase family DNA binding protein